MTTEPTIHQLLAEPFKDDEIKSYSAGSRTMTYIDARSVMNRLDEVVGTQYWWDEYSVLDMGSKAVECRLSVMIDGAAVTKVDVGYPNDARDADDDAKEPLKAAYSDAFKRAGVKFGIGRHLYAMPAQQARAAPSQRQHEAPAASPLSQQLFDSAKLNALMAERGIKGEDMARVTGGSTLGSARVWLQQHPNLTVVDLVDSALAMKLDSIANAEALKS